MKKNRTHWRIIFASIVLALFMLPSIKAQTADPNALDGKIYVRLKSNHVIPSTKGIVNMSDVYFVQKLRTKYQLTKMTQPFYQTTSPLLQRTYAIEFNDYKGVDALIAELKANDAVEKVEKCPYFKLHFTPNDYGTTAGNNWHLTKINAQGAWDYSQGNPNILVAVIDNAIWTQHPDLAGKVAGQIDLGDGDNDPTPPSQSVEWSHGTHTSGLAVAATNNGIGVSSIGFNCRLLAIKAGRDSDGALAGGYEGITWAADNGARVINMSWGSTQYFDIMQDIVDYAYYKGCVLVAAAGNDGNENVTYPAGLNHVISVGSTDGDDKKSQFSQYNATVDLCAPGGYYPDGGFINQILNNSVYSLAYGTGNNAYTKMGGTSMSSPIAAGLAALMIAKDTNLSPDRVERYMKATCFNIYSISGNSAYIGKLGAGRINAQAALKMVQDSMSSIVANFKANSTITQVNSGINFFDMSVGTGINSWTWTFQGATPSTSNVQNPTNIKWSAPGVYTVTLLVSNGTNHSVETKTGYIRVIQQSSSSAWIEQATGFTTQYRGIDRMSIVNNNVAWATAYNGVSPTTPIQEFTRTTDGGNTWTPGVFSGTGILSTYQVSCISAIDANTAWVAFFNNSQNPGTNLGGIYKTTDGGQTWERQSTALFNNSSSFPNVVHFWDANNGWCMGDPVGGYYEMYTTTDGGTTWTRVPQANISAPAPESGEYGYVDLYDVKGDTVWFGSNKGHIYKSVDRGLHWTQISKTATGLTDVTKLTFNDAMNGVAHQHTYNTSTGQLTAHVMKKTNNGGTTWTTVTTTDTMFRGDICAVHGIPGKYFAVGRVGMGALSNTFGSAYTLDYGATWNNIDTGVQYVSVKFLDNYTGWAGGFNLSPTVGGIYKWRNPNSINVTAGNYCPNATISIGVTVGSNFGANNVFNAELSDANGNFNNPIIIGSNTSSTSCIINGIIPVVPAGSGYKVRVVSTDPVMILESNSLLNILALPIADAGADAEVCYTSSYSFNATAQNHTTVNWITTNGSGLLSNDNTLNAVYTPVNADSSLNVEFILSATGTCGTYIDTVYVHFSSNAVADAGANVTVCQGTSVQLNANGGNTYKWAPAASLNAANVANPIATPDVTTVYYVTATSDCGSAVDSVVVTVNPLPNVEFTASNTEFCFGGSATLTCTTPATSYQWYNNANPISGATNSTYTATQSGNYSLQITDANGCSNQTVPQTIIQRPQITVNAGQDVAICNGSSASLSASSTTQGLTYTWTPSTGLSSTIGQTVTASPTATTTYVVKGTDDLGCFATDNIVVTVNAVPAQPTITFNPNTLTLSVTPVSGATYQWYLNGNAINGATSSTYVIPSGQTGSYTCIVTKNGCSSPASNPFVYTSIGETAFEGLSIYPNPNKGVFTISFSASTEENIIVEISNMLGQLVYTHNYTVSSGSNTINVAAPELNEGIYLLQIKSKNGNHLSRIVIQ